MGGTLLVAPLAALVLLASTVGAHAAPGGTANVTLAWDANTETNLGGYRLHFGTASRVYSGSVMVGATVTTATASNLLVGKAYFFAVTASNAAGLESDYSAELAYTIPVNNTVQIRVAPNRQVLLTVTGSPGHTYAIQATTNFTSWTVIGSVMVGAGGSLDFTDTNAPNFPERFYRALDTQP